MARLARPPAGLSDDDDDEFPDITRLVPRGQSQRSTPATSTAAPATPAARLRLKERSGQSAKTPGTVRRRKLGPLTDNLLLRAWTPNRTQDDPENAIELPEETEQRPPPHPRVQLRPRTPAAARNVIAIPSSPADEDEDDNDNDDDNNSNNNNEGEDEDDEEYVSAKEEISIAEDPSIFDGTFQSCSTEDSEDSDFEIYEDEEDDDYIEDDSSGTSRRAAASPAKRNHVAKNNTSGRSSKPCTKDVKVNKPRTTRRIILSDDETETQPSHNAASRRRNQRRDIDRDDAVESKDEHSLADIMKDLDLSESDQEVSKSETPSDNSGVSSSSDEALRKRPGLTSPKKLPRIPKTPHRPSSDLFWDKDFIDDWNDEHSPRKQLFPDTTASRPKSPTKDKKPAKGKNPKDEDTMASQQLSSREAKKAKKAFEEARDAIAQQFLQELDTTITKGRVSELTASTGGVKIVWSKTLQRTAGRAHWKVEPVRVLRPVNQPVGADSPVIPVPSKPPSSMKIPYGYELVTSHYLYHASIELAEKVVTDELRLLNVMAHEFCHLANYATYFMTARQKNVAAHGKEFQQWGRAVTTAFAHRGVRVTTKHSWDIEYKYIWECVDCFLQFKRHSKSIDPAKQRCGRCKGRLNQIKPKPRGGGQAAGADEPTEITPHGAAREVSLPPASSRSSTPSGSATAAAAAAPKVSAYQQFLKENMRAIRAEKPNTPHKEVMKLAAERWQEHKQRVAMMQASKAAIAEVVLLESSQGESEMEEESVELGGLVREEV